MSTEPTEPDKFSHHVTATAAGISITTGMPLRIVQEAVDTIAEQDREGAVLAECDGVIYLTPEGVELVHNALTWDTKYGHVVLWELNTPGAGLAISRGYGDRLVMVQDNGEFDTLAEDASLWLAGEWGPEYHDDRQLPPCGASIDDLVPIATPVARYSVMGGVQLLARWGELSAAAREYLGV